MFVKKNYFLVLLLALPLILYVIFQVQFFQQYLSVKRAPRRFVIPDSYSGFVVVVFENPSCQVLGESSPVLYDINSNGDFCTSSQADGGFGEDMYVYKSAPQQNLISDSLSGLNRIWYEDFHRENQNSVYTFYVGDKIPVNQLGEEIKSRNVRIQKLIDHKSE